MEFSKAGGQSNSSYLDLLAAFKRLDLISDPVAFCLEFEAEQRQSGLRLSTFKAAWKAWKA